MQTMPENCLSWLLGMVSEEMQSTQNRCFLKACNPHTTVLRKHIWHGGKHKPLFINELLIPQKSMLKSLRSCAGDLAGVINKPKRSRKLGFNAAMNQKTSLLHLVISSRR